MNVFVSRHLPLGLALAGAVLGALMARGNPQWWALGIPCAALAALGIYDLLQTRHAIRRNYPIIGNLRFLFESIRPELRQYFFEDDKDAQPFSRAQRSIVYQRAKQQL